MGLPGSTYRLIFDVLVRCQKIIIFGRLPDGPTNRASERQGPNKSARSGSRVVTFGIGGRGGASRALSLNNKTTGSIQGDGVCHADGRGPGELFAKPPGRGLFHTVLTQLIENHRICVFRIVLPPGRRLLLTPGMGTGMGWGETIWDHSKIIKDHFGSILGPHQPLI